MNPVLELASVAHKVALMGDADMATRIQRIVASVRREATAADIVLDSWSEFETWFLKNRSQGLQFVIEDQYGPDSQESTLLVELLELYETAERKLHDYYEVLKAETPAPVEDDEAASDDDAPVDEEEASVADDVEAGDAALEESVEDTDGADAADAVLEEIAADDNEEPSEGEAAAEEALAPAKEASVNVKSTKQAKTITRLQKLLRKAKLAPVGDILYMNDSYRVQFQSPEERSGAAAFFATTGMTTAEGDHPVKLFLLVTP